MPAAAASGAPPRPRRGPVFATPAGLIDGADQGACNDSDISQHVAHVVLGGSPARVPAPADESRACACREKRVAISYLPVFVDVCNGAPAAALNAV